jgi:hypothetical protein
MTWPTSAEPARLAGTAVASPAKAKKRMLKTERTRVENIVEESC